MLKAKCVSFSLAVGFDVTLLEPDFLSPLPDPASFCRVLSGARVGEGNLLSRLGLPHPLVLSVWLRALLGLPFSMLPDF